MLGCLPRVKHILLSHEKQGVEPYCGSYYIGKEHEGERIVDIIPRAVDADFPSNLRLVMTSRWGKHLTSFPSEDLLYLDDEAKGYRQASQKDIRAYIDRQPQLVSSHELWSQ